MYKSQDYNPGGRLAVTFPKSVGQIPFAFPFQPGSDESSETSVYGALYPFGNGLSYTTFQYSDLAISPSKQGDVYKRQVQRFPTTQFLYGHISAFTPGKYSGIVAETVQQTIGCYGSCLLYTSVEVSVPLCTTTCVFLI